MDHLHYLALYYTRGDSGNTSISTYIYILYTDINYNPIAGHMSAALAFIHIFIRVLALIYIRTMCIHISL
jgi:hypothetical protein